VNPIGLVVCDPMPGVDPFVMEVAGATLSRPLERRFGEELVTRSGEEQDGHGDWRNVLVAALQEEVLRRGARAIPIEPRLELAGRGEVGDESFDVGTLEELAEHPPVVGPQPLLGNTRVLKLKHVVRLSGLLDGADRKQLPGVRCREDRRSDNPVGHERCQDPCQRAPQS